MYSEKTIEIGIAILAIALAALLAGCGGDESDEDSAKPGVMPQEPEEEPISAEAIAKLPAFDALDGTADKVVHLCAGCDFSMDGSAENPIAIEDYTLHFCNPHCAQLFKKGTNKKLLALEAKTE